jgi:Glycosyltransferase (GlcNAc)
MTTIRRPTKGRNSARAVIYALAAFFLVIFISLCVVLFGGPAVAPVVLEEHDGGVINNNGAATADALKQRAVTLRRGIRNVVEQKRTQLTNALQSLTAGNIPARLRALRERHEIVGERLAEVKRGSETVQELLHQHDMSHHESTKPPMALNEIIHYLDSWIHQLHEVLADCKHATFEGIWQAYHDLAVKTLYPWDRDYLSRMPPRREDGSVFLSLATYRDENCFNTVYNAYDKAKNPEKLFIGLVQQNCHADCKSGVLENLTMVHVPPDDDCYTLFCETALGKPICAKQQLRVLNIDEPESLGPYAARYFASKLYVRVCV